MDAVARGEDRLPAVEQVHLMAQRLRQGRALGGVAEIVAAVGDPALDLLRDLETSHLHERRADQRVERPVVVGSIVGCASLEDEPPLTARYEHSSATAVADEGGCEGWQVYAARRMNIVNESQ